MFVTHKWREIYGRAQEWPIALTWPGVQPIESWAQAKASSEPQPLASFLPLPWPWQFSGCLRALQGCFLVALGYLRWEIALDLVLAAVDSV